jgi:thymidylate synthase
VKQYLNLCRLVLNEGLRKQNRTGVDTIGIQGAMMKFDLEDGFPAVTTKKLYWRSCFAEMLGFLRGYDSAQQFRALGCKVWDANANENEQWLTSGARKGRDDLGRIYGVQARDWSGPWGKVDQLRQVVDDLSKGIDNRREIVTHWNPGELCEMALPPCHLLYQFGIQGHRLNLSMYQRSCDMPLGVPFNIAGYAWLLSVIARVAGLTPGTFTHFLHDVHVYVNQVPLLKEQIKRKPHKLPTLVMSPAIHTLEDLETWVRPDHFELKKYKHHEVISYPFSV